MTPADAIRAFRQGTVVAAADLRAFYTWRTWLGGWLVRVLCQVVFYSLLASLVGDEEYITYVILGAALMIGVTEAMLTSASTTWDRYLGTPPLLAAAPSRPGFYFVGRSVQWPVSGVASTSIALFTLSPFFGVSWSLWQIPVGLLLVAVTTFATYGMALVVGAVALTVPGARNVLSSVTVMAITAFCGVLTPVDFWPAAVRVIAQAVPVTHGLEALRQLEGGGAAVAGSAGLAALTGLCWTALALLAFHVLFARARRGSALLT
ncbi:ABC transporter permease [Streptomyces sp. DSM 44915]|uniref:ABC transporter permease n=1 Tax=Streptomyces chisholmiae TaxID=3075540 RepID=A0ABU2JM87_9ACTN|nr:ABC transporter permease [Streptomyces sp. DSM 44915]MDT0266090.1 ABC transporter permease [Streptomyces sp. DSM 44915]